MTRAEAKTLTATAMALRQLPATAQGLARGRIGVGQAQVAARALSELERTQAAVAVDDGDPQKVAAAETARRQLDELVADQAPGVDRSRLRRRIDKWQHTNGSDVLAERERRVFARRHAWIGEDTGDPDAMTALHARLDTLGGARVKAAVDALSRPTGADDPRDVGQRRCDALVTMAELALGSGELPQVAAQRPHVLLVTTAGALHDTPGAQPSQLDGIGAVSADTARQICCDADVAAVAVDGNGAVLDVGRVDGTPTPKQRKAVIARDRRCVGRGAAATACQVHHIVWRSRGGPTIVDNLCLLCWTCHHNVHHNGWVIARRPDGRLSAARPDPPSGLRHTA